MKITYEKQYTEQRFEHFTLYQNLNFSSTHVFWEYYNLIKNNPAAKKEELIETVKSYKKTAKSKLRISYIVQGIEFYKESKYIFPEFYIRWEELKPIDIWNDEKRKGVKRAIEEFIIDENFKDVEWIKKEDE